jgi:DNA repair exonuclease SbcCD nuclease subunit
MSRWIFFTDCHFRAEAPVHRTDDIFQSQLNKMESILQLANELDAYLICGGDLFDKPSPPDFVGTRVASLFAKYGVDIYYILGNHDLTGGNVETYDYGVIGMFEHYKWFHFLNKGIVNFKDCLLMGTDFNKSTECANYIPLNKDLDDKRVCMAVVHEMITDDPSVVINLKNRTINWQEVSTDFDIVLCGHFHPGIGIKENAMKTLFINPGAMTRLSANEVNRKVKVAYIEIKDKEIKTKLLSIPFEKNVFNVNKIEFQKNREEERDRFAGALESIKDEDIMAGNVINILDNLTKEKLPQELQELLTEKIIDKCKKKLVEVVNG